MSAGKGDKRRSRQISREEETLRWKLAWGKITRQQFDKECSNLKKEGLIKRNG